MDWAEYLTHFTYLVEGLKDYRDELSKKHSDIDQKICDILHYIELCETDDNEAADLVELLRVCRENNANAAKAKQALKCIKGLETRKYKPRKYEELFENCVLKDRRLQREDIYETVYNSQNTKQRYSIEPTFNDKGGEETMVQERNYTPFDGKENDWVSFAKQQAEFYRNAGQYITNLQIDIKEIEAEIEDIMGVSEHSEVTKMQPVENEQEEKMHVVEYS